MRHNEASKIKWSMIDLSSALVAIPPDIAQSNRGYTIPISDAVVTILKGRYHLRGRSEWVFESERDYGCHASTGFWHYLPKVRAKCGLYFHLGDIRRTFLEKGIKLGVHYLILKALTNQNVRDITARYIVPDLGRMQRAAQLISEEFISITGISVHDLSAPRRAEKSEHPECRQLLLSFE